jgi:CheY-like chemotaxis protein
LHFNGKTAENKFGSGNGDLIAIDALRIDDHSRMTLTKKLRKVFSVEIDDVLAIFHDKKNGDLIIKIQRGERIMDSWVMKRCTSAREDSHASPLDNRHSTAFDKRSTSGQFKIMLVDDEPDVLLSLKLTLESMNYIVDAFDNSTNALNRFIETNRCVYNLVITDIRMPAPSGLELYRKLKEVDCRIKVLFCTALNVEDEVASVLPEVRNSDFLRKPIECKVFLKAVETSLQESLNSYNSLRAQ